MLKAGFVNTYTVKPWFTNALDHEQFGLRTDFPNTKRLGWRTVSRVTNKQAVKTQTKTNHTGQRFSETEAQWV